MSRHRSVRRDVARPSSFLLLAVGALSGLALGLTIADRLGGVSGLLRRRRDVRRPGAPPAGAGATLTGGHAEGGAWEDDPAAAVGRHAAEVHVDDGGAEDDDGGWPAWTADSEAVAAASPSDASLEGVLEERVLAAFREDPVLRGRPVDISAAGPGVIVLAGWVQAPGEAARAAALAGDVPGVTQVVEQLLVRAH